MNQELVKLYNEELFELRKRGQAFANAFPKVAGRLKLGHGNVEDPMVGRLIESFAFLTARVRQELHQERENLSENFVQLLYPHYYLPIPACSTVSFAPASTLDHAYTLPAKTVLSTSLANDDPVNFSTVYPVTIYPIEITAIEYRREGIQHKPGLGKKVALSSLSVTLSTLNSKLNFAELGMTKLRFFINGSDVVSGRLFELLLARTQSIELTYGAEQKPIDLDKDCLKSVGFSAEEGLLPYPENSFLGYRYLTEFFAYPDKFYYLDLEQLDTVLTSETKQTITLRFYFDDFAAELVKWVDAKTLLLHTTPIINLFEQSAEPIIFDHSKTEYPIITNSQIAPEHMEVYSVQALNVSSTHYNNSIDSAPYFGRRFHQNKDHYLYWHARRQPCARLDKPHMVGDEMFISISDFNLQGIEEQLLLTPKCLCTNRAAAEQLPYGGDQPKLSFRDRAHEAIQTVLCVKPITETRHRPTREQHRAEIAEHVYLNNLGLGEQQFALKNLKQLLALYSFPQHFSDNLIEHGLVEINVKSVLQRHPSKLQQGFCYGSVYQLTIDESYFTEQQAYLLGMILYQFMCELCSINRTFELHLLSQQRGVIAKWPPQIGKKSLI
ncbi:MAG: type VI secretion system baseplate subunit TssF [Gammaproteobacteria bacterium]|nr:type VI secretion system baseplate subunit TssF [Gammaproteobacteria bacterium]